MSEWSDERILHRLDLIVKLLALQVTAGKLRWESVRLLNLAGFRQSEIMDLLKMDETEWRVECKWLKEYGYRLKTVRELGGSKVNEGGEKK